MNLNCFQRSESAHTVNYARRYDTEKFTSFFRKSCLRLRAPHFLYLLLTIHLPFLHAMNLHNQFFYPLLRDLKNLRLTRVPLLFFSSLFYASSGFSLKIYSRIILFNLSSESADSFNFANHSIVSNDSFVLKFCYFSFSGNL